MSFVTSIFARLRKLTAGPAPVDGGGAADGDEPRYKPIDLGMVGKLMRWMRPYARYYAGGIAIGTVVILIRMLGPKVLGHLVDYTTAFVDGKLPGVTVGGATRYVVVVMGVWAVVVGATLLGDRARILLMTFAGESVQFDLRRAMFAHLQRLSMSFYDKTKLGRIISRCTSDVGSLREVNVWGVDAILQNVMMMVVAAAFLATATDVRLFLAVCWIGPVLYAANRVFLKIQGTGWQVVREGFTRVSTNLAENITGVRVVTAFNRQEPNLGEFNRLQVQNTANNIHAARIMGVYMPTLGLIGLAGKMIILVYGAYLVTTRPGEVTVGRVVEAFLYWDWFTGPIQQLGTWYNNYMQAMAGGERVLNLLETEPDVRDAAQARDLPPVRGFVEFDRVTFGYNPDRPVLHDVSFTADPGQMVALVGATGSGKSSIISLIARFYQPQHGRVLVDGYDVRHVTGDSLHRQMGLVLQVNYLFTGTVLDNIRYARPRATEADVVAAATALGTHDAIAALKDGYRTEVGERGASMSLGQRQLICFTRAYLADPRIFMLDEATSAVDTATEAVVQASLERLLAGRTTFVVAHRLSTVMRADKILVIDHGRIIESGTHHELVQHGGRYAHLYEQFVSHAT